MFNDEQDGAVVAEDNDNGLAHIPPPQLESDLNDVNKKRKREDDDEEEPDTPKTSASASLLLNVSSHVLGMPVVNGQLRTCSW